MLTSSVWRGTRNVTFFNRGLLLGGTATGVLLLLPAAVAQAAIPLPVRLAVLGVLIAITIGADGGVLPFRLPQNARQVPSSIVVRADGSGALQFGFEMGTGLRTFMPTHIPYLLVGFAVMMVPWWAAPLLGATFGAGRALMVHSAVRLGDARAWDQAFAARRGLINGFAWAAALVGVVVAGAAALTGAAMS